MPPELKYALSKLFRQLNEVPKDPDCSRCQGSYSYSAYMCGYHHLEYMVRFDTI